MTERHESRNGGEAPHPHSPDNPERIADFRIRYEKLIREAQPDAADQLIAAFLDHMAGKEYGYSPLLSAFSWFWDGWAASSGARAARSETERVQIPSGWKLVPLEPTLAMKEAAAAYRATCVELHTQKTFGGYYRAMVAAAPEVPTGDERRST